MARRKKRQKLEAVKPAERETNVPESENIAQAKLNRDKTAQPDYPERLATVPIKKGISVATCIAGMFLSLVLGIYLGTLLPGIYGDIHTPATRETPRPEPGPAAQETQKIDPNLAQMIGDLEKKASAALDSAPDWINLGNIYFDAFLPEKAIPAYEHALRLAPQNADVLTDLGIMYRETGQFSKALECFRNAVHINPRHENALYNEGVILSVDLKKNDEAKAAWQRLLDMNPQAQAPNGTPLAEMIRQLN